MSTQPRNPMGLEELRVLLDDVTSALGQLQGAIGIMQDSPNQQGLLVALYTKALMVKLQVQADMERLT